jgi:predicted PurR-regulated permease PerM
VASGFELRVTVGIIASVAIAIAAYQAANVFAPLALAIFIIAIVWPLQSRLQLHMPKLVALAITLFLTIAVCIAFASLAVWAFSHVGHCPKRSLAVAGDP